MSRRRARWAVIAMAAAALGGAAIAVPQLSFAQSAATATVRSVLGRCLTEVGGAVQVAACSGSDLQRWSFQPVPGGVKFRSLTSGRCLTARLPRAVTAGCSDALEQVWRQPAIGSQSQVRSVPTGRCLTASIIDVTVDACANRIEQAWLVTLVA